MSKIQKALGKIQAKQKQLSASRQQGQSKYASADDNSITLAKLVMHAAHASDKAALHIDRQALREAGLIAPEYHEQLLANQYREIKRPLIAHAFGKRATRVPDGNLIMVTSALAGEGKTFTSINLAFSMALERDHQVLLVDADVAKPHMSETFGAKDVPGLLDALEDSTLAVESLILPTDVPGFSVLPAGQPRVHATELLASAGMERLVATLSSLSDGQIVVFDSPPLLETSEAKIIAGVAGQIVMVVRAEETSHEAVEMALSSIGGDKAVNLVLNQVRSTGKKYQYGYGYAYGTKPHDVTASKGPAPDKLWG